MKKSILLVNCFILLSLNILNAQNQGGDFMRNIGMIYVVIGVIIIIWGRNWF